MPRSNNDYENKMTSVLTTLKNSQLKLNDPTDHWQNELAQKWDCIDYVTINMREINSFLGLRELG